MTQMTPKRTFLFACVLTSLMLVVPSAYAQAPGGATPERAFRLSLELPILGFYRDSYKEDGGGSTYTSTYFQSGPGAGRSYSVEGSQVSLPHIELGIGGKVSRNFVIGARLQAMGAPGKMKREYEDPDYPEDNDTSEFDLTTAAFSVVPYLEIISSTPKKVRPFFLVAAGFKVDITKYSTSEGDYEASELITVPRFAGGLGGGFHVFFVPRCSVDFTFLGMVEVGKAKYKEEYTELGVSETDDGDLGDVMRIFVDATVGISAWI